MGTFVETRRVTFYVEVCCNCGVQFAMTQEFHDRKWNHRWENFYCPNGHGQHYLGKSEADRLRDRLKSEQENAQFWREREASERKAHSATKGILTKTKNRVANGVCPCCNRTFANLARHMAGQHPDFKTEPTE